MTRINTNVSSLVAQKTLARSNVQLQEALARLSTGLRINRGKDDPAGLIAAETLRLDITSVQRAITNSERANQLVATADSALGQVASLINDIRGLVSEAANTGALSAEQIAANQLQVDSSLEAIDRIAQTTQFQGRRVLDGSLDFIHNASQAGAAARGRFGTSVDAAARGQLGSALDVRATGAFGNVSTDARAVGTFGTVTTDRRAVGSFGSAVDQKAAVTLSGGGGSVRFIAQSVGAAGNGYTISYTSGLSGTAVAISFDATNKVLQFQITDTNTAANIVSALQAHPAAYQAISAEVVASGVVTAGLSGTTVSGSSFNNVLLSAVNFGSQYNNTTVSIVVNGSIVTGSETASYSTATNTLTINVNTGSTTARVISAINATGVFTASTTGAGLGVYSAQSISNVTTGGSANNQIILSASTFGSEFNGLTVVLNTTGTVAVGSETATYTTSSNTLTINLNAASTTAAVISAINSTGVFNASTTGAGLGTYSSGSTANVTTGGSASNRVLLSAVNFGSLYNGTTVLLNVTAGVALGSETASYNTGSNILTVNLNTNSTAAAAISAINATGVFTASALGSGLGKFSTGVTANVTSGGSADNRIILSANQVGTQYNNTLVSIVTSAATGSETASYNTATNTLTLSINQKSTAAQVAAAINANGVFTASLATGSSGLGTLAAGTYSNVTTGGSFNNQIALSATSSSTQFNNLTITLVSGAPIGGETASYSTATNTLTITINDATTSSRLASVINATGLFSATLDSGAAGLGTYTVGTTTGVTSGAGVGAISDVRIEQANFGTANQINVNVQIDRQATRARLMYTGGTLSAALNLEVGGSKGFEVFSFGAGTTVSEIASAINLANDATGITASVDSATGTLTLQSDAYGSNAFVSAKAVSGTFSVVNASGQQAERATGTDVQARINGIAATGEGLRVTLNTSALDLSFQVASTLTDGSSIDFAITGGGAIFQLGPDVVSNQQARLGIGAVNTALLGGATGKLFELRTGGAKSLAIDPKGAAAVVEEAITAITSLRGRLGAFQRTTLETNIFTLNDALENLTDAQSSIRDADYAEETARLTRAQILVQSGTVVLQIANQSPQNVLALLQG